MATERSIADRHLRTARLLLRPLTLADLPEYVRFRTVSAAHLRPWEPLPPADKTVDEYARFVIEQAEARAAADQGARFVAIWCPTDGAADGPIAGLFNLNNIVRGVFQNADAGWSVSAEFIGRGVATEGVHGLLTLAFAPAPRGLGLHRVQANIDPSNIRSLRVAEKCGFRREGLARRMLCINGEWRDQWMHARLVDEHAG